MKRRPIEERLQNLENLRALATFPLFDLTELTDEELAELERAVLTGEVTPRALTISEKARIKAGDRSSGIDL